LACVAAEVDKWHGDKLLRPAGAGAEGSTASAVPIERHFIFILSLSSYSDLADSERAASGISGILVYEIRVPQ
jgi:hypothetical protein